MKPLIHYRYLACFIGCTLASTLLSFAVSLETAPPVVVKTSPVAGTQDVDPRQSEIVVTFSKPMTDGSWSWSTWSDDSFPEMAGQPRYLADQRTCVLPVKLQPGRFYALWLNSEKFRNFKDAQQNPAVPYLLTFRTALAKVASEPTAPAAAPNSTPALNPNQQAVLDWTDRQFRGFFDGRSFDGWSAKERADLESRLLDTLKGPVSREYYQAINSLAALRATNALPALRVIGLERRDKDNRDRWMAIRALSMIGDRTSIPELIHLVYHGNANTRWWAQIALVRITGQNFGTDWKAWGAWWNDQKEEPPFQPEIIRWWNGQAEPDKLASSLAESDEKFLSGIRR